MKRYFALLLLIITGFVAFQCGSGKQPGAGGNANDSNLATRKNDTILMMSGINSKGVGRFDHIQLTHPIDQRMASDGQDMYERKCLACHKLTSEMLVGPGWYGVTRRRTPEWIMNWITNTKVMLDKDLAARADMVVCLIRMPNQDLSDEEAREVLEFMRKNDGEK